MTDDLMVTPGLPGISASEALWERARNLIPGGTQTYAKGPGQFIGGVAPKYLRRGRGSRVWDVDGNEYIDLNMGVGPVVLGHRNAAVDEAIRAQLEDGITFTLMHPLEVEVAERIRELVPCAEAVRFSKTGADVTSAAVRAARAFTGREKVLCCGYHGWHDWFISTTDRAAGVPGAVQDLTGTFEYNDPDSFLSAMGDDVACVILEPMVFEYPASGFLELLRERCTEQGALLVFDEMWTGFRLAMGGAQQKFGVTPDLATFSKAIANGMPISVLCGRADVMQLFERDLFFYTTFGGEALSLAAAAATMEELDRHDVPAHLERIGGMIRDGYNRLADELGMERITSCIGAGCRTLVTFGDVTDSLAVKTLMQQELIRRGVLWPGGNVVSFAHSEEDAQLVLDAFAETLPIVRAAIEASDVHARLRGEVVAPAFRRTSNFNTRSATRARVPDLFSLENMVAVVTGAGGLLGRQHVLALAGAGARVVLVDLHADSLTGLPGRAIAADVTSEGDVGRVLQAVLDDFGRVDILVNNAALNDRVEAPELSAEEARSEVYPLEAWRRMLDVNVTGVFLPTQLFGARMVQQRSGSIINISSTYGLVGPEPSLYAKPDGTPGHSKAPSYPVSKGAVLALTRHFAVQWGRSGVRVNALVPGGVRNRQPTYFIEEYARRTPLGRMAEPDDYRGALVFLASNASRYMTGAGLVVDGGFTAC